MLIQVLLVPVGSGLPTRDGERQSEQPVGEA